MFDQGIQPVLTGYFVPIIVMAALFIAVSAWVIRIGLFFIVRFQKRDEPNPFEKKETLGLPKGAMRTFLAITFTAIGSLAIFSGIVDDDQVKWVLGELGVIITFYFGSKSLESYVDSRAKIRAIEKATTVDEALRVLKDEQ